MPKEKESIKPEPIDTIILENEDGSALTRQQLIDIGFPELYNPITQFNVDRKTMEEDFNRTCRTVVFLEGQSYEQYLKNNPDTTLSKFMEAKSTKDFAEHNKNYLHQGSYLNNVMSLMALGVAGSKIIGASITTKEGIQTTKLKSQVKNITMINLDNGYLDSFKEKQTHEIKTSPEESLIDITTKVNTDNKKNTNTSYIKIDFYDKNALHYYSQCVVRCKESYAERKAIENIVRKELSEYINETKSHDLIEKTNDINPSTSIDTSDGQANYFVVLLKEIKALNNNNQLEKPINNIIKNLQELTQSGKLKTFTQGDLYAAMLKNKIILNLSSSDIKKYENLYKKDNTKDSIINILQSYYNKPSIGTFFNTFRHNTGAIKQLEDRIQELKENPYKGDQKGIKKAYREIIIDEMKKQDHFNGHGEMAKMTGFLVKQLDSEIAQLEKQATADTATTLQKN